MNLPACPMFTCSTFPCPTIEPGTEVEARIGRSGAICNVVGEGDSIYASLISRGGCRGSAQQRAVARDIGEQRNSGRARRPRGTGRSGRPCRTADAFRVPVQRRFPTRAMAVDPSRCRSPATDGRGAVRPAGVVTDMDHTPFASGMLACTAVAIPNTAPLTANASSGRPPRLNRRSRLMPSSYLPARAKSA